jgi:pilus assembly protein Flp/PilA
MTGILKLLRDARGATAVEYALILALIVLAMVGALATLAGSTITMWNGVSQNVQDASR